MPYQGITLHHLATAGMPGDDDFAQGREFLPVAQALEYFIQGRIGTHRRRPGRFRAGHPVIAVPAQKVPRQVIAPRIAFIEKLRCDDQGIAILARLGCGGLCALQVGHGITQPTVDDDQYPLYIRHRPLPVAIEADAQLTGRQFQVIGADFEPVFLGLDLGADHAHSQQQ